PGRTQGDAGLGGALSALPPRTPKPTTTLRGERNERHHPQHREQVAQRSDVRRQRGRQGSPDPCPHGCSNRCPLARREDGGACEGRAHRADEVEHRIERLAASQRRPLTEQRNKGERIMKKELTLIVAALLAAPAFAGGKKHEP